MNTSTTFQDNRTKVQTWLMEEGWSLREDVPQPLAWGFIATDTGNRHIAVGQRQDRSDQIIIQAGVTLTDQQRQRFVALKEMERRTLQKKISTELLHLELQFNVGDLPEPIIIAQRIYDDGLTKDAFFQRFDRVMSGVIVILMELAHFFSTPEPEHPSIGFSAKVG